MPCGHLQSIQRQLHLLLLRRGHVQRQRVQQLLLLRQRLLLGYGLVRVQLLPLWANIRLLRLLLLQHFVLRGLLPFWVLVLHLLRGPLQRRGRHLLWHVRRGLLFRAGLFGLLRLLAGLVRAKLGLLLVLRVRRGLLLERQRVDGLQRLPRGQHLQHGRLWLFFVLSGLLCAVRGLVLLRKLRAGHLRLGQRRHGLHKLPRGPAGGRLGQHGLQPVPARRRGHGHLQRVHARLLCLGQRPGLLHALPRGHRAAGHGREQLPAVRRGHLCGEPGERGVQPLR